MSKDIQLSLEEFRKHLQPQRVRALQIIYIALGTFLCVFCLIVLTVYFVIRETGAMKEPDVDLLKILTIVYICVTCMEYLVGFGMYQYFINKGKLKQSISMLSGEQAESKPEKVCLGLIATGTILRSASCEGVALFGLIICLVGSLNGTLQQYPIYWLNLFSFVFMILYLLTTFPTRQKLEDIFQRRFGDPDVYQGL